MLDNAYRYVILGKSMHDPQAKIVMKGCTRTPEEANAVRLSYLGVGDGELDRIAWIIDLKGEATWSSWDVICKVKEDGRLRKPARPSTMASE